MAKTIDATRDTAPILRAEAAPNITVATDALTGAKTYTVHGSLILKEDTAFDGNLVVEGSVFGEQNRKYCLTVKGDITALDITAWNINAYAWNITARNISADDIKASRINAWNINARDITALDITTGNIAARNISAGDITAWNITAWDIDAHIIFCEKLTQKPGSLLTAVSLTEKRSTLNREVIKRPGNREA